MRHALGVLLVVGSLACAPVTHRWYDGAPRVKGQLATIFVSPDFVRSVEIDGKALPERGGTYEKYSHRVEVLPGEHKARMSYWGYPEHNLRCELTVSFDLQAVAGKCYELQPSKCLKALAIGCTECSPSGITEIACP